MKVITWNVHRAVKSNPLWKYLFNNQPDIALLQEVGSIPDYLWENFQVLSRNATTKFGTPQKFSTAILVKGKVAKEIYIKSEFEWVNNELEFFKGNIVGCVAQLKNNEFIHLVSAYSPAWPVDKKRLASFDTSAVKLKENPDVWATEILWSGLKNTMIKGDTWIVGGDLNSSETFDREYQKEHGLVGGLVSGGNKEIRERMYGLGFIECLREYSGKLVPTFKHSRQGIVHQLDYIYVTSNLYPRLNNCSTGERNKIFGENLSDHLPVIAVFSD